MRPFSVSRQRLELESSSLACRFISSGTNKRNAKLGQRRSGRGHVTYFFNSGTPSIPRERLELETSNLACRFIARGTNRVSAKLGQRGSGSGHVTYIWNFGAPCISLQRLKQQTSNFVRQCIMTIPVTINRSSINRKYNFNMADVRFLKSEVEEWYYFAAQWHFGDVLRSNIIFCDICCFRSASWWMSSLKGFVNC